ncbi:TPA: hypothetical protein HA251_00760 [Candidatus Woesearchaeota archaeon]|nr:hypothetical protein [Candidatus Woesearchaeota archaeon]
MTTVEQLTVVMPHVELRRGVKELEWVLFKCHQIERIDGAPVHIRDLRVTGNRGIETVVLTYVAAGVEYVRSYDRDDFFSLENR